jgi:hypothetical protein
VCDDAVQRLRSGGHASGSHGLRRATQGAVAGHPSDGEDMKTSKSTLEGLVSLVLRKGHFRLLVASI